MKEMYINLIREIKEYCDGNLNLIGEYEKKVIDLNIPELSYLFAKEIGGSVEKHEQIVLNRGNERLLYLFANGVKGADIKLLEDKLYEGNNLSLIHNFYLFVNGADI